MLSLCAFFCKNVQVIVHHHNRCRCEWPIVIFAFVLHPVEPCCLLFVPCILPSHLLYISDHCSCISPTTLQEPRKTDHRTDPQTDFLLPETACLPGSAQPARVPAPNPRKGGPRCLRPSNHRRVCSAIEVSISSLTQPADRMVGTHIGSMFSLDSGQSPMLVSIKYFWTLVASSVAP